MDKKSRSSFAKYFDNNAISEVSAAPVSAIISTISAKESYGKRLSLET